METGLKGKTALVTGGASGIGLGIAEVLAGEGVHLAVASRNPDPEIVRQLQSKGVRCTSIAADVSREEEVVRMVETAIRELGHLDFFVNNAAWAWHQPVTETTTEAIDNTFNTNLKAFIWGAREAGRHMVSRKQGSIVVIGSTSRLTPIPTQGIYRISKMGLYMHMQQVAIELAPHNIRVNMVTPGHFKTRFTSDATAEVEQMLLKSMLAPQFGNPQDVGNAVAFLLSDRLSPYTWGSDLIIDGGLQHHPVVPSWARSS